MQIISLGLMNKAERHRRNAHLNRHQVTSIEQATTNYTIQSLLALAKVVGVTITTKP